MSNSKVKNLLKGKTENITFDELLILDKEYRECLRNYHFPKPPENTTAIAMIDYLKRRSVDNFCRIGPYENISVFEAANRIASDLVLIRGVIQIINDGHEHNDKRITLLLGTKHVKGMGDFKIGDKHGEAFNVAPAFYKAKLYSTIKKWTKNQQESNLSYILINHDVVQESDRLTSLNFHGIRIVGVDNWRAGI